MNEKSTIYWTAYSTYLTCPQQFLYKYGWGNVDIGHGPGKGKPRPEKRSMHHAVMGIVIQYAIERMYNDELYRDPKNLSTRLLQIVETEWRRQAARKYIDYQEARMSEEEMLDICRAGVKGYLKTMKAHKLLGEYSKAEVNLLGWINKWVSVGGRADMIIRRSDTGVTILDGKNSRHKGKYTDPDQLRWYALLFRLTYREMPDRIGFVWYRYPHGEPLLDEDGAQVYDDNDELQVEQGVEWVDFTEEDLRGLAQRVVEARDNMRKEKFEAKPVASNCRFCDWESVCPERQAQYKSNAEKRGASKKLEELDGADGFVDLF